MNGGRRRVADVVDAAIEEALREPGCPACRLVERSVERYFDVLLWELVNDTGVRQQLRTSLGLCPRHTWTLVHVEQTQTRNVLGLAILFQDIITRIVEVLGGAGASNGLAVLKGTGGARVAERRDACPACRLETSAEGTYLARLMERARDEAGAPDLGQTGGARAPERSAGRWCLCPAHLSKALASRGRPRHATWGWARAIREAPAPPRLEGWLVARLQRCAAGPAGLGEAVLYRLLLPRPLVVGAVTHDRRAVPGDTPPHCPVCSALARGRSSTALPLTEAASGPGITLCPAHLADAPGAEGWLGAARRAVLAGEVHSLRCARCEEEAATQSRLLRTSGGPFCFPHLLQRLALDRAATGIVAGTTGHNASVRPAEAEAVPSRASTEAIVRLTVAYAVDLAGRLAGFIRKQDWNVQEPLTPGEAASVREAARFLGGYYVVFGSGRGGGMV
ncbi:MAG: hypothetical protein AB1609_08565 [Bacillota bacterium]